MSRSTARKARDVLSDFATLRTDLSSRYVEVFHCPADLAPWGTPWRKVLEESLSADEQFIAAYAVLERLRNALNDAVSLLGERGLTDGSRGVDGAVGLTGPEVQLYTGFALDDAPLGQAYAKIERWCRLMEAPLAVQVANQVVTDPRQKADFEKGTALAKVPQANPRWVQSTVERVYRKHGTSRRYVKLEVNPSSDEPLPQPIYDSVIGGVPPRSPGETEWRRGTLVRLLDDWHVQDSEGGLRRVSDTEIAIVSLLQGGLAEVRPQTLKLGLGEILKAERRAIDLARKRRGPSSALIEALRRSLPRRG